MPRPAPTLRVDLAAVAENYRTLAARFQGKTCGAVVKADAYGLGASRVAPALARAGCTEFFVATQEEGAQLRAVLPDVPIYVFHGPHAGEEKDFPAHRLIPVINSVPQWQRWQEACPNAPFALHVDTGMNRLGLTLSELEAHHSGLASARLPMLLLSHLACASETDHPLNARQLAHFARARALLPGIRASLCNSSGIFLGAEFHFDLARPGCALYGINPTEAANPMRPVATLTAPILQIRHAEETGTVGYGGTFAVEKGAALAIVQMGYADGYLRHLSNKGTAYIGGHAAPVAGRVSMDMIALDARTVPESVLTQATEAEILGPNQGVDALARAADTIGYEIFTRLGARVKREYVNG